MAHSNPDITANDNPAPDSRKPGRSFEHHDRPLGEDLLAKSPPSTTQPDVGDANGRTTRGHAPPNGVAERAKAIGVMRKAEELMASEIPPPSDAAHIRRAFELAAGRLGLKIAEYDVLVKDDPELEALHAKVVAAALARGRAH